MKIDPAAQQLLTQFKENWNPILAPLPLFHLDTNWPSVATLDLISYGARLSKERPRGMQNMIRGCACYLAQVVGLAWSQIAEDVRVRFTEEEGVVVSAEKSEFIEEGQKLEFFAEQELKAILEVLPDPFTLIRGAERRISFDTNIVSLLGIGACVGLHPSVRGAWTKKSFADLKEPLQRITKELARQSSEYYARVFPKEPLGAVAEVYLSSLVFPPLFVGEPLPALQAIQNVFEFAKRYNVKAEQLGRLGHNWARLADDTLSAVGLVLYAACQQEAPSRELIAAAQTKAEFMGLLRPALLTARSLLAETEGIEFSDWLENGLESPESRVEFEIERELLFLPWLVLSGDYVKEHHSKLKDVLAALSRFDRDESLKALDPLIEEDPTDISLRLQRIKLEMIMGDWEKCDGLFRSLLSESDTDSNPLFFHLWSIVALASGDAAASARYCKAGLAVCDETSPLHAELKNNCGWATLVLGEVENALAYFEQGIQSSKCPLTLLLNKAHVLWRLGQNEKVNALKDELAELAPTDRRVFTSLATREP